MNTNIPRLLAVATALWLLPRIGAAETTIKVAADGSGRFETVQEAIAAAPESSSERTMILIGPGEYKGNFVVPKSKLNLTLKGDGAEKTILTWDRNTNDPKPEGAAQFNPGLWVQANGFHAENLTIRNTSGDHGQALAAEIDGDEAVFKNCRFLGWQDTLMANNGRQYYEGCYIEGRVDFIYGSATAVFSNCEIHSKNGGFVTAASTPADHPFGFVFLNCKLTGSAEPWVDPSTGQAKSSPGKTADLGRPWRASASVAFINCQLGDHISPAGWNNWGNVQNETTARFSEYGSKDPSGKPIDVSRRVRWAKQLTDKDAAQYTVANILDGGWGLWDPTKPGGQPTGIVRLGAKSAHIAGNNARLENGGSTIGFWSETDTRISWDADLAPGKYRIGLSYALDESSAGSDLQVQVGSKQLGFTAKATSGWDDFRTVTIGEVDIVKSGRTTVELGASKKNGNFIANVREVILKKQ